MGWTPADFHHGPCFYNSREIKELGIEAVKIKGARSAGVLLTESAVFVIYNLGGSLMKWQYRAEMRTKALMQTILCRERLPEQYAPEDVKGLLLGDNMELAATILSGEGGRQYLLLDGSYEHFYYLTNDRRGEKLLRMMCNAELSEELEALLLTDLWEKDEGLPIENDAIDGSGSPVLFAYTCDLPRIRRFDTALRLQNKAGTLICFDFQAEALRRCCGEQVRFQTINFENGKGDFAYKTQKAVFDSAGIPAPSVCPALRRRVHRAVYPQLYHMERRGRHTRLWNIAGNADIFVVRLPCGYVQFPVWDHRRAHLRRCTGPAHCHGDADGLWGHRGVR